MFSLRFTLALCVAVLAASIRAQNSYSTGTFVVPNTDGYNTVIQSDPTQQFVFVIGSNLTITWRTVIVYYNCYLAQLNLTDGSVNHDDTALYRPSHPRMQSTASFSNCYFHRQGRW